MNDGLAAAVSTSTAGRCSHGNSRLQQQHLWGHMPEGHKCQQAAMLPFDLTRGQIIPPSQRQYAKNVKSYGPTYR